MSVSETRLLLTIVGELVVIEKSGHRGRKRVRQRDSKVCHILDELDRSELAYPYDNQTQVQKRLELNC